MRENWIWSQGWEDPLEKGKATHSSYVMLLLKLGKFPFNVRVDLATYKGKNFQRRTQIEQTELIPEWNGGVGRKMGGSVYVYKLSFN